MLPLFAAALRRCALRFGTMSSSPLSSPPPSSTSPSLELAKSGDRDRGAARFVRLARSGDLRRSRSGVLPVRPGRDSDSSLELCAGDEGGKMRLRAPPRGVTGGDDVTVTCDGVWGVARSRRRRGDSFSALLLLLLLLELDRKWELLLGVARGERKLSRVSCVLFVGVLRRGGSEEEEEEEEEEEVEGSFLGVGSLCAASPSAGGASVSSICEEE
jgi:hypothetical protein